MERVKNLRKTNAHLPWAPERGIFSFMVSLPPSLRSIRLPSLVYAAVLGALLVLSIDLSSPALRHGPTAAIPWPVHGIALAIVMGAPVRLRVWAAVAVYFLTLGGAAFSSGNAFRSMGGATLVTAEAVSVTLLHHVLSGGRHPLRGTLSLWWFGIAFLFGVIPISTLSSATMTAVGHEFAEGFFAARWWIAAVTSMGAITPILLIPGAPLRPPAAKTQGRSAEFAALATLYLLLLSNAFLGFGNETLILPPVLATVPFLLWGGLRFGVRGYGAMVLAFLVIDVSATLVGLGPFATKEPDAFWSVQQAWIFAASLIGPMMMFPLSLSERASAETRAQSASAQLAAIIESTAGMFAAVDRKLTLIAANPAWIAEFKKITGVDATPGMRMRVLMGELPAAGEAMAKHFERALAGEHVSTAWQGPAGEGSEDEYEVEFNPVRDEDGAIVGASQVVRNVSERRRAEAATAEQRRLEAVGRLAGGVAHDFNNLMTAVVGYAGMVSDSLDENDPRRGDLQEVHRAATRAGELTQQLLAFARRRVIEPQTVDIGELVRGFARMLAPLLGGEIRLTVKIADSLPSVRVDPLQLEQVLVNLAANARDAMPLGGELAISVEPHRLATGDGVRIAVRDTGVGMAPEVLAKIWEPFFTTKPRGKGTGLGLATVHGIMHQAGGDVQAESTVGVGTTIGLLLPAAA